MATDLGPNAALIGEPGSVARLATPALVLDLDRFEGNVAALAGLAAETGMQLRPHAKTHKSSVIAKRQFEAGAVGICCATLREAEAMVAAGVPGVLITSPMIGDSKLARLGKLAVDADRLAVVADHPDSVRQLDAAMRAAGARLRVLLDIDIGHGRTGVANEAAALTVARTIAESPNLIYAGVQAYSGRVQHIESYPERQQVYGRQLDLLATICDALRRDGLPPRIVSGGGTGSFALDRDRALFTELQCGSYIFMDVEYGQVALFADRSAPFETALFVQCSVVSANQAGFVTIDGGLKSFATDGPAPLPATGAPPGSRYEWFGDEHGKLILPAGAAQPALGATLRLVAPHCDPTVNLHDRYHCIRGNTLVDIWPIDARGSL